MAYSTIVKTKRDGLIQLRDGTGSPVTLDVSYEDGNLTFETPLDDQTVIRDRGALANVRKGDSQPITGSFAFHFRQFTDSANPGSVTDFCSGSGNYSANISTGLAGPPYVAHFCVDIQFKIEGTDLGDAKDHQCNIAKAVCSLSFSEGESDVWTLSFTAYGGVVYT